MDGRNQQIGVGQFPQLHWRDVIGGVTKRLKNFEIYTSIQYQLKMFNI